MDATGGGLRRFGNGRRDRGEALACPPVTCLGSQTDGIWYKGISTDPPQASSQRSLRLPLEAPGRWRQAGKPHAPHANAQRPVEGCRQLPRARRPSEWGAAQAQAQPTRHAVRLSTCGALRCSPLAIPKPGAATPLPPPDAVTPPLPRQARRRSPLGRGRSDSQPCWHSLPPDPVSSLCEAQSDLTPTRVQPWPTVRGKKETTMTQAPVGSPNPRNRAGRARSQNGSYKLAPQRRQAWEYGAIWGAPGPPRAPLPLGGRPKRLVVGAPLRHSVSLIRRLRSYTTATPAPYIVVFLHPLPFRKSHQTLLRRPVPSDL